MIRALLLAIGLTACSVTPDPYKVIQFTAPAPLPQSEGYAPGAMISRSMPVTAYCRDDWISYSQRRRGTCAGHGGVREWVNRPAE